MVDKLKVLADTPLEQIGEDELTELGNELDKVKEVPASALKILKVLTNKKVTAELLKSTLIGKRIMSVSIDEVNYDGDASLLSDVKEIKDSLYRQWKAVYKKQKEKHKQAE
jgi:flagellin-specific chaperone FliS